MPVGTEDRGLHPVRGGRPSRPRAPAASPARPSCRLQHSLPPLWATHGNSRLLRAETQQRGAAQEEGSSCTAPFLRPAGGSAPSVTQPGSTQGPSVPEKQCFCLRGSLVSFPFFTVGKHSTQVSTVASPCPWWGRGPRHQCPSSVAPVDRPPGGSPLLVSQVTAGSPPMFSP